MNVRAKARTNMYARLALALKWAKENLPEFGEDDYREILRRNGAKERNGKYSATTMHLSQLYQVENHFKQLGYRNRPPHEKGRRARVAKLNAMWCALADAGAVDDRSEAAMESWCRNNVPKFTQLRWATGVQLNKAIEMLKQWAKREGVLEQPSQQRKSK